MNKTNKKYICWLSLFLIFIIIFSIILSNIETFENSTIENRVTILENKINGIDNNLQKTNKQINNIDSNLQKTSEKITLDSRINILDNNATLLDDIVSKFKVNDENKYSKMYLWYAKLTGADPELVKKEQEKAVENNEKKFKNLEAEMEQKYNKK